MMSRVAVVGLFVGGCFSSTQMPRATGDGMDEATVLSGVVNAAYRTAGTFHLMNPVSYPSAVPGGSQINVWVTNADYGDYAGIDPGVSGSHVVMKQGAVIVREVLDVDGSIDTLTVIAKGPTGYDATVGDLWFGVTDPSGTPIVDPSTNTNMTGKLSQCFGCHQTRPQDAFLFGVPAAARTGHDALPDLAMVAMDMSVSPDGGAPTDMSGNGDMSSQDMTSTHDMASSHDMHHHHHPCGDFLCEEGETCQSCPSDCTWQHHDCQ